MYKQALVDPIKEIDDFQTFIETYGLKKPKFKVIYYKNQLAYWIKTREFEYVLGYESYEVLMKVRF